MDYHHYVIVARKKSPRSELPPLRTEKDPGEITVAADDSFSTGWRKKKRYVAKMYKNRITLSLNVFFSDRHPYMSDDALRLIKD